MTFYEVCAGFATLGFFTAAFSYALLNAQYITNIKNKMIKEHQREIERTQALKELNDWFAGQDKLKQAEIVKENPQN